ncbi:MAG: hypothetical protein HQK76_19165 [Desulfobacterales bacterium]|nr:hypothetical protein [Desulfobacterales bacterium]
MIINFKLIKKYILFFIISLFFLGCSNEKSSNPTISIKNGGWLGNISKSGEVYLMVNFNKIEKIKLEINASSFTSSSYIFTIIENSSENSYKIDGSNSFAVNGKFASNYHQGTYEMKGNFINASTCKGKLILKCVTGEKLETDWDAAYPEETIITMLK